MIRLLPLGLALLLMLAIPAGAQASRCAAPSTSPIGIDVNNGIRVSGAPMSCNTVRQFARTFARVCNGRRQRTGDCSGRLNTAAGIGYCRETITGPPGSGGYSRERCSIINTDTARATTLVFYAGFVAPVR
jgi:hypothetical protein